MRRILQVVFCFLLVLATGVAFAGEIPRAADAPQPLPPAESQKSFQLPAGFRIDLVASEPLLADPSAMLIDHAGRFFVCELHGYNLEGHLDIVELNKTGNLDREVRRVRVEEGELMERAKQARTGTVKRLSDMNGDGLMDDMQIWADGLPACYGMAAYRDGLVVVCGPDIIYLADRDGDGKAEVRETLFSGFDVEVMERAINNPIWGLDNWIYVAKGSGNPTARGPNLDAPVHLGGTDFRFLPDGSAIEAVTGANGTFGHTFTDYGDRFLISTSTPAIYAVPLPRRYLVRNPFVPSPSEDTGAAGYNRIYPTSQPHPWRAARGADPNWVKFYGGHETTPNGFFTSGCSPVAYRANAFPAAFTGNHFCCDPSNNLVHRTVISPDGAGYRADRAPGEEQREFLTSTDQWFRPMNLYVGPDGALYVVDIYREIIEDYSAIPRFLQQQYGLVEGSHHGRIWRVSYESTAKPPTPRLHQATDGELVELLVHPNSWWREHAQRLLIERQAKSSSGRIVEIAQNGVTPQGRVHALYTLDGLQQLTSATVRRALSDSHFAVRRHALRLAERWMDADPDVLSDMRGMSQDQHPQVRLQLAMSLGASRDPSVLETLAKVAMQYGQERWMAAAIMSSVTERAHLLSARLLEFPTLTDGSRDLLDPLAACVGARGEAKELNQLLTQIASLHGDDAAVVQGLMLKGLLDGLQRESGNVQLEIGRSAMEQLLRSSDSEIMRLAFALAARLGLEDSPLMVKALDQAKTIALDHNQTLTQRLTAVGLLSNATWQQRKPLSALLKVQSPLELQIAAVRAIASQNDSEIAQTLVKHWPALSAKTQEAISDAMFARADRLPALLSAVEEGIVNPSSLSALRRAQLLEHGHEAIRKRAVPLFAKTTSNERAAIIRKYQAALNLEPHPDRGRLVFDKQCSKCHRLNDQGFAVGPDLSGAVGRPDTTLLVDMLDPSSAIKPGYAVVTVSTDDGRAISGVLADESATSVTIRQEKGVQETVLRHNIEEIRTSSKSLMPDGFEKEVTPHEVADLIAYLRQALGPARPTGVVLFDEERDIAGKLTQGGGTAEIWTEDQATGDVCLRITPSQRYNSNMPGWSFAIVEDPQPGQYRYLRMRWKTPDASGPLIELAAGGRWPPSESPQRRYYSGKNTTQWQAQQVSMAVPQEWTMVTVDLFKDNGAFTLTGFAPTAMDGPALFDRIELLRSLDEPAAPLP